MAAMKVIKQVYEVVPVDSLTTHPANPRRGDVGVIGESIEANGFYGAVIVQKSTGYVLAGNHRLMAAREAGADSLPVIQVDVDDATATRILLADNRTNDLATYDQEALAGLLKSLADQEVLVGSGYDADDIGSLNRIVEATSSAPLSPYDEWKGMPEYEQANMQSVFHTTIHFGSAEDADAFFELIGKQKLKSLWWPDGDGHVGSNIGEHYVSVNG